METGARKSRLLEDLFGVKAPVARATSAVTPPSVVAAVRGRPRTALDDILSGSTVPSGATVPNVVPSHTALDDILSGAKVPNDATVPKVVPSRTALDDILSVAKVPSDATVPKVAPSRTALDDILSGATVPSGSTVTSSATVPSGATVSSNVTIPIGAMVPSVLTARSALDDILSGATVQSGAGVSRCATVQNGVTVPSGAAVLSGAKVPTGAAVSSGATVRNGATVPSGAAMQNAEPSKTENMVPVRADDGAQVRTDGDLSVALSICESSPSQMSLLEDLRRQISELQSRLVGAEMERDALRAGLHKLKLLNQEQEDHMEKSFRHRLEVVEETARLGEQQLRDEVDRLRRLYLSALLHTQDGSDERRVPRSDRSVSVQLCRQSIDELLRQLHQLQCADPAAATGLRSSVDAVGQLLERVCRLCDETEAARDAAVQETHELQDRLQESTACVQELQGRAAGVDACRRELLQLQEDWMQLVEQERARLVSEQARLETGLRLRGSTGAGQRVTTVRPSAEQLDGMFQALQEERHQLQEDSERLQCRQRAVQQMEVRLQQQLELCRLKSREADEAVQSAASVRDEAHRAMGQARQLQLLVAHRNTHPDTHRPSHPDTQEDARSLSQRRIRAAEDIRCLQQETLFLQQTVRSG